MGKGEIINNRNYRKTRARQVLFSTDLILIIQLNSGGEMGVIPHPFHNLYPHNTKVSWFDYQNFKTFVNFAINLNRFILKLFSSPNPDLLSTRPLASERIIRAKVLSLYFFISSIN